MVTCDFCGRTAPRTANGAEDGAEDGAEETVPLTWSTAVERGRLKRYCDVCSREHLRAMEGKLDQDYW